MVQHYQFAAIASPGDIIGCYGRGMKNLAYYGGEYFYAKIVSGGAVNNKIEVYSVSSLTDDSETLEGSNTSDVEVAITNCVCRNFGDDIYAFGTCVGADADIHITIVYSTDGGVNWTALDREKDTGDVYEKTMALDIINLNGDVWIIYTAEDVGHDTDIWATKVSDGTTWALAAVVPDYQAAFGGNVIDDVYYYLATFNADTGKIRTFDGTGEGAILETTTSITLPTYDCDEQMFYVTSQMYIVISKNYIYMKDRVEGTDWVEYNDSTYTWGVVWDHNTDNDYIINYFIFASYIWKINELGIPTKIQAFAANAGHGYEDWFTDGTNIYQATLTALSDWKNAKITTALYIVPQLTYQSQTEPFDEQLLEIYEDDYAIDEGIMTDLDSDLTGWTDADGANTASTYEASKTLDFSIAHVLQLYDNSVVNAALRYNTTFNGIIGSFWIGTSDSTKTTRFVAKEGATSIVHIYIDGGHLYYYDGVGSEDLGTLSNSIWAHIVFQITIATTKVKIWVDGIYINEYDCDNAVTTSITRWDVYSEDVDGGGYYGYFAAPYCGFSLAEALSSYWAYQDPRLLFRGYVTNVTTDGTAFVVTAIDPIGIDLNLPVTESFVAHTAHAILKDVIDTYCLHLWYDAGISTTPATTYTIDFTDSTIAEVIRFCDSVESYQTSIRPTGEVYWDTYTEVGHALDDGSLIQALPLVSKDIRKFGRFKLFGGFDSATGLQLVSTILQNINFDTYTDELPSITNQTDLDAANAVIAAAKNISLKKLTFHSGRNPVIYPGEEAIVTLPQHSITGAVWYCITSNYSIDQKRYEHVLTDAYWQPPIYMTYTLEKPAPRFNYGGR